ncbi:hypothetical protein BX661DRAFT_201203 [Kickxella alabastrina]|uniref:uncharacterized protein n=1 Tax=Kickxella alabastrina TaxID=61397 RepID=UPI00221FB5B9|nr:uncharacterized protein BX661DRAFT_201203 [Kickxella alabastrina]KAI7819751.1 hypothetical protein BX661DRAFT_201203 [Kickxella alabastrina]
MFQQKHKHPKQHKHTAMSRELNSLYLENHTVPVPLADLFQAKPKFDTKAERWTWRPFKSSARTDNLTLSHWVKSNEKYTDYYYARYNAKTQPYQYTDLEYDKCIAPLDARWSKEETDYLLVLCRQFDLRFIVVHDRYYVHPDRPACVNADAAGEAVAAGDRPLRSLEDLKDRYYSICRALTKYRAGEDSRDPDDLPLQATNKLADDLALLGFDGDKERERKQYLELLFSRTKEEIEEEEMLIVEARRIESNERRLIHEREAMLNYHALFEEAPSSATIPSVKVQFTQAETVSAAGSSANGQPGSAAAPASAFAAAAAAASAGPDSVTLPKVRKGAPDAIGVDGGASVRPMKKQKSIHGSPQPTTPVTPRVKSTAAAAAANKASANKAALGVSVASTDSVSAARGSSVVRNSMSPSRAASVGIVKQEHLDGPVQFGPVTFSTEDHLVNPAIIQIDTPETGPIFIAQRDARLGPGVFLRSDKLFPIPKNKLEAVKQFMTQLDLNSPNTIWPRPVMATAAVCDRFDTLQTTIIPLLDCKKVADKLETEIQVLRARKRMLMNDVGESRAEEIIKKLPPIDPSMIAAIRATTPSTPTIDSTPVAASRHNRKGSTTSSRKKAARE